MDFLFAVLASLSAILGAIGVALIVAGFVFYVNFRRIIREEAKKEATTVAKEVAEHAAREYIQKEMPKMIKSNESMRFSKEQKSEDIGQIANDADTDA